MADIVTSRIFVDGEKGITAAKLNDIVASSVIQPAFYTAKPTASTVNPSDIALILQSGAYAQAQVSTLGGAATQAQIWSTRLRSFNAVGNPNFEITQRNIGNVITGPTATTMIEDRWASNRSSTTTLGYTIGRVMTGTVPGGGVQVPGTSFAVSNSFMRLTLTTAQATLAAGDFWRILQNIEGPVFRELMSDVFSISLLVRSSVANVKFGVALVSSDSVTSLTKLCTMGAANTWTLITLPNCAIWPASGVFNVTPGLVGCLLEICLAAGSTYTSPAADTWQNAHYMMPPGASNFANNPVNSTWDIGFAQIEPGSVCSTLMDKPFTQNLDECLRYYCKSYDYGIAPGAVSSTGVSIFQANNGWTNAWGTLRFPKPMAKAFGTRIWNPVTGAGDAARGVFANTNFATSGGNNVGVSGFNSFNISPAASTELLAQFHYTADSGW